MIAILHNTSLGRSDYRHDVMRVRRFPDRGLFIWTLGLNAVCSYSLRNGTIELTPYYERTNNNGG